MSSDSLKFPSDPEYFVRYIEKPHILTLLSGGTFFAVLSYFLSDYLLNSIGLQQELLRYILPVIIIAITLTLNKPDTVIKIYPNTGKIFAEGEGYTYEAMANEPEVFMVLQKKNVDPRTQREFFDYKLTLKADEETTYEIAIPVEKVRMAIDAVEKAKNAVK